MFGSLKKALGQAAPRPPDCPLGGLGLARHALRRLNVRPCPALRATGTGSTFPSARLGRSAGGPLFKKSVQPASLSFFSTGPSSTGGRFAQFPSVIIKAARSVWGGVAAVATIVAAIASFVLPWRSIVEKAESERTRLEVEAILAARAPPSEADELHAYVKRVDLEKKLESFLREPRTTAGSYMVVVGPRGAGKSTLVSHVLSEMGEGVLVVSIKDKTTDVEALVLRVALDQYKPLRKSVHATSTPLKDGGLAERLKAAADAGCKKRGEKGWRPTLVLEIAQSGDKDLIKNACNLLKLITHDKALCHGILVLSSSFAVAELPEDEDRQRFLRVGAFSRDEASAHLDANLKANLPVEVATVAAVAAVKERILQLATLPKKLGGLTAAVLGSESEEDFQARAEAWASEFEASALTDVASTDTDVLNTFIRDKTGKEHCFTMCDLMRELLDTSAPVRLPNARFDLPAARFACTIRTSLEAKKVFDVDLVSKTVDFASGAHRQAAAELLPQSSVGPLSWLFGGRA
jgi:hypothetical protein